MGTKELRRIFMYLLYSLLVSMICLKGVSQQANFNFKNIGIRQGLSNNNVTSILQDKNGITWISTLDGLNRFDGEKIKQYNKSEIDGLKSNYIFKLSIDKNNDLWLFTEEGINVFNIDTETIAPDNFRWNNQWVFKVFQDDKGDIYYTGSYGIYKIDVSQKRIRPVIWFDKDFNPVFLKEGFDDILYSEKYNADEIIDQQDLLREEFNTCEDWEALVFGAYIKGNQLWFGDSPGQVYSCDVTTGEIVSYKESMERDINSEIEGIEMVYIDSLDNIWFGDYSGSLIKYDYSEFSLAYQLPPMENIEFMYYNAVEDDANNIFFGTDQGLLFLDREKDSYSLYKTSDSDINSLSHNRIHDHYLDSQDNLWIGFFNGNKGVDFAKASRSLSFQYIEPGRLSDNKKEKNTITDLCPGEDNSVWIGTLNGLYHYNPYSDSYLEYMPDYSIRKVLESRTGDVWVLTGEKNNPMLKLHRKKAQDTEFESIDGLDINVEELYRCSLELYENSSGQILIGALELIVYTPGSDNVDYYRHNNLSSINEIIEDENGNYLIARTDQLLLLRPCTPENIDENIVLLNALHKNVDVWSLEVDKEGSLWVSGDLGVSRIVGGNKLDANLAISSKIEGELSDEFFNGIEVINYSREDGLLAQEVYNVISDINDDTWICTGFGLAKYSKTGNSFSNYDIFDGLAQNSVGFSDYGDISLPACQTPDGNIYLGSEKGITKFHPDNITNTNLPDVYITDFKVFNKSVKIGEELYGKKLLEKSIVTTDKISLTHKHKVFSFDFKAIEYIGLDKNIYTYQLVGFDKEPIVVTSDNLTASYTNLPGGEYVFKAMISDLKGKNINESLNIVLTISPPFWKTWWFISFAILFVSFIVYRIYQLRIKKELRDKELLQKRIEEGEKLIAEKIKIVDEQKAEMDERDRREKEIRFYNRGITLFSDILNSNRQEIKTLCKSIISELTKYVGASAGVIYIVNDGKTEKKLFAVGSYCYNSSQDSDEYLPGEGYIGACYSDKQTIKLNDLPEGYISLESGLGTSSISNCVIVPALEDENCYAVVEIGSNVPLSDYKIKFIEKVCQSLASVLALIEANEITNKMLSENKGQAEELKAQEEELRQNLEELQATQDMSVRKEEELSNSLEYYKNKEIELLEELDELKELLKPN